MRFGKIFLIILFVILPNYSFSQELINLKLNLKEKQLPFGLVEKIPRDRPVVSLALSGGGARAISHIGVIKAIEELNIPIDHIIGTSMGSVIGGLYSAGYAINDLDSIIKSINWEEMYFVTGADRKNLFIDQKITEDKALVTLRLNGFSPVIPQSIIAGNKISNLLTSLTLNAPLNNFQSFDSLLYKYRAISTELVKGEKIVLENGSLSEAMRASSSVSFLLPPIKIDSMLLVDGGIVDNLPIKTALEFNPDIIIASDATSALRTKSELKYPWEIADQLVTIPSKKIWEENKNDADFFIKLNLKGRRNNNFSNLKPIIDDGYNEANLILANTKNYIDSTFKSNLPNDKKYFKNIKSSFNPNFIEKDLISKYSKMDSVSKVEILYDLYSYYEKGIYKDLSATISQDSYPLLKVRYQLNPRIKTIKIGGISLFPIDSAYKLFNEFYNNPYNSKKILNKLLELLRLYRSSGFLFATIENISFDKLDGELSIQINEGFIDEVLLEGNQNTLDHVVKREFSSVPGDHLLFENFKSGLQSLTSTDLFDNIVVDIRDGSKSSKKLVLKLEEKLPNVLRLGLRNDDENFTQLAFDIRNENLFGDGSELGLSITGGSRNVSYVLEHKSNRIFNTYLTYKAHAFYKYNDVNQYKDDVSENEKKFSRSRFREYRQRFYGGFLGVGAHFKKFGTFTAEGKFEVNEVDNIFNYPKDKFFKLNIFSLKLRLQIDSQNKYPYPTKGMYINTFYETAQKIFWGDISFAKFSFDYSGYFPLNENHNLKPRIIFGFADETLPLTQQFSFGGQPNFFGYRNYEFRGRQVFIGSIQYRYKLPTFFYLNSYLKVRYDIGSTWEKQEQIRFDNLKHGLGLTFSLDTPIGPADLSVGRSLLLKDTSPSRILIRGPIMFYFTIGYYY